MPGTALRRQRLQAAFDHASERFRRDDAKAAIVIAELVEKHGAIYRAGRDPNRLSVAGVAASCTWSADTGLLQNWIRTAAVRLMIPAEDA